MDPPRLNRENSNNSERKDLNPLWASNQPTVSPGDAFKGIPVSADEAFQAQMYSGSHAFMSAEPEVFKAITHLTIDQDRSAVMPSTMQSPDVFRSLDKGPTLIATNPYLLDQFDSQPHAKKGLVDNFSSLALSSTLPSADEQTEPPSPKGGYLEPYYHNFTVAKPQDVLQATETSLRDNSCDVESKPHKFKLVCATYQGSGKISFKVRIYRVKATPGVPTEFGSGVDGVGTRYCIEFQRRSGDCVRFSEIYRAAMSALSSRGFVRVNIPPSPKSPFAPSVPTELEVSKLGDTVKFLVQMASSEYCDVMVEGMRTLCDLSSDASAKQTLIAEGVFDLFLSNCGNELEDVNRCSLTGLANLAESRPQQCSDLVSKGTVRSLIRNIKDKSCPTPQIVRETTRLLVHVSEQVGRDMIQTGAAEDAQRALQELMCSSDPVVRHHADQLQQFVGADDDSFGTFNTAQV